MEYLIGESEGKIYVKESKVYDGNYRLIDKSELFRAGVAYKLFYVRIVVEIFDFAKIVLYFQNAYEIRFGEQEKSAFVVWGSVKIHVVFKNTSVAACAWRGERFRLGKKCGREYGQEGI